MKALIFLALLPALALAQVRPPSGVPTSGGTFTGPVTASVFPPAQDFIFYAGPTGADSNDCTSALTPCLTLQAAVAKLPPQWKQKARIILAAGTYTITGAYNLRVGAPIGSGEPAVIQGAMEDSGLGERTISGVTTYGSGYVVSITDSTAAPTLDQYEGYFLRMTTCAAGAGCVGMTRIIRGNSTGGQFDLNMGGTSTTVKPAIGDKFVIERPASVIAYDGAVRISSTGLPRELGAGYGGGASLILNKLRFVGTGSSSMLLLSRIDVWANTVSLYGNNYGIYVDAGSGLFADAKSGVTSDEILGTVATYGSGMYLSMSGAGTYCLAAQGSTIDGTYAGRNCAISGRYNSDVRLFYLSLRGTQGVSAYNTRIGLTSTPYGPLGQIIGGSLWLQGSSSGPTHVSLSDMVISNSPYAGIGLEGQSFAYVKNVSGTGNTGAGISVTQGSYLLEGATVTIAGTTSEVLVGDQTTTHAAIAGGATLSVPPHGTAAKYGGTTPGSSTVSSLTVTATTLGTCGTWPNVAGTTVSIAGATTTPTKLCVCTYTPTGTVYAWVNALANNAGTGIGNTTTCP